MTDKQLKKLKKGDLLELLLTQSREIDRLKAELEETKKQLEDRRLLVGNCGSIAEASLAVYHVLEDAQKAAELYLENVKSVVAERTGIDEAAVNRMREKAAREQEAADSTEKEEKPENSEAEDQETQPAKEEAQ